MHPSLCNKRFAYLDMVGSSFYENLLQNMYCVVLKEIVCVLSMCSHSYKLFKTFLDDLVSSLLVCR